MPPWSLLNSRIASFGHWGSGHYLCTLISTVKSCLLDYLIRTFPLSHLLPHSRFSELESDHSGKSPLSVRVVGGRALVRSHLLHALGKASS